MNEHEFEDFPRMREHLFNDALGWICSAAAVSVCISLVRAVHIGWQPLFLLQPLFVLLLVLLWINRRRVPYTLRVSALLAVVWLSTFAGLLQFGPVALSGLHAVFFSFIAILFLGMPLAGWLIAANTLCLVLVGGSASRHWIEFGLDYPVYAHSPLVWLLTIWNVTTYAIILGMICWRMVQGLLERDASARQLALRQQKIAANVPGVIYQFLLRANGSSCFPYVSDGVLRLLELSPEALRESADVGFARVHAQDQARHRESMLASARTLSPIHDTFRVVLPERGLVWVERTSTPERLPNGDTLWHGFMRDVTALKRAEQRLSDTLENTPNVAVQWFDGEGRVLYWNHAAELAFGWTPAQAMGKTLDQLILSEDETRDFVASLATLGVVNKIVGPNEYVARHRDGWERVMSSTMFAIPGDTSPIYVCMDIDITDRKRAEMELLASEQRFRQLFDNVHEAVAVHSLDGRVLQANHRMLDLFGVSQEEFGKYSLVADFSAPGMPVEKLPAIWADVIAGNENHFEWRARRPRDGSEFDVEVTLSCIRYGDEDAIMVTERDITEQKRITAALSASESLFRLLLESSPLPILVKGADQKLIVLNQRFVDAFGYTLRELPDLEHWWLLAYRDTPYRESMRLEWYRRLTVAVRTGTACSMETMVHCKDGTTRPIEILAALAGDFSVYLFREIT